jgi:hypothetical protein
MSINPEQDGIDNATGLVAAAVGPKQGGREKSASNYSPKEHEVLLEIIEGIKDAFESSVGSPIWQDVYQKYLGSQSTVRSRDVLHTHFAEMKAAIGSAISALSTQVVSIVVPKEESDLPAFYAHVHLELIKKPANKVYQSSKWWDLAVVSRLVRLHIAYLKRNGTSQPGLIICCCDHIDPVNVYMNIAPALLEYNDADLATYSKL